jgi:TRAP transporter TAXI family solute receptor
MRLSVCFRVSNPHAPGDAQCYRSEARRYRPTVLAIVLVLLIGWNAEQSALGETKSQPKNQRAAQQKKVNDSALLISSGRPGTSYFAMARDIVSAIGETDELRLVAVDSGGGTDNIRDLLFLRGIDLALVPANVLAHASTAASFGPAFPQRVNYISQLYSEEIHILVGRDIASIEDLRGRKVAVPRQDGNAEFSVNDLLQRLQVEAEVVPLAEADAIDELRSGAIAALVLMGGKPLRSVASIPKDGSLRLLPLPHAEPLGDAYAPAAFRSSDYPSLIADGQTVETVSVGAVLVANNMAKTDESYRRVAKFVPAFFTALSELAGPQWHPKWSEVNLATDLAGWARFAAARELLTKIRREQATAMQKNFEEFLSTTGGPGLSTLSPKQRRELFEEFIKWSRKSVDTSQPRP